MKATCNSQTLAKALRLARSYTKEMVLLSCSKASSKISIGLVDHKYSGTLHVEAVVEEDGEVIIQSQAIYGLLSKWKGDTSIQDDAGGRLQLTGPSSKATLQTSGTGLKGQLRPPPQHLWLIPVDIFTSMSQLSLPSTDESLDYLQIQATDKGALVTTTNRVCIMEQQFDFEAPWSPTDPVYLSTAMLSFAKTALTMAPTPVRAVRIGESQRHTYLIVGNNALLYTPRLQRTRLIDISPFKQSKEKGKLQVAKDILVLALQQCSSLVDQISFSKSKDTIIVQASHRGESITSELPDAKLEGDVVTNKLLASSLLDVCQRAGDDITLAFHDTKLEIVQPNITCFIGMQV